ncbi:hypothetical protein [Sphingomonas sp. M1-B02]|uniref:hypothetical protein n=1 Tax=Sphingomonas sp. M1-B02 TaxID=3114300 RepID=UPI00223F8C57|nr:hypothetical protein [Sphingomonas sp. S6-11]UZK66042.1 hypothetical protein OKW87_16280 [Sphingomonas sp. S6-11]
MRRLLFATLLFPVAAAAQDHSMHDMPAQPAPAPQEAPVDHSMHDMPAQPAPAPQEAAMDHSMHDMAAMPGMGANAVGGSGSALLPAAEGAMRGFHATTTGNWMLMAHGVLTGVYTDQGGPRGDDMAVVQSMAMLSASRPIAEYARIEFRAMLSLEPAMGRRGYPNLFATGETANGRPLVDRQHPHDLFMELSARADVDIAPGTSLFLYGGPVAEPALGPSAFMHRRSARYLPLSPIGHHWFDSTHITYGVVTAGAKTDAFQFEGSAFKGREPDEARWNIDTPRLDSWSVRATWTPSPHWTAQISHGRLKEPEVQHPGEDEARTTASLHYARGGLSAMLGFSAKNRLPGDTLTAWVGEANWDLSRHHSLFGRIENVANDELFPDHADPLHDRLFRITRFEAGYAHRIPLGKAAELALGGSLAAYAKPAALDAAYGKAPISGTLFARLALGQ